MKERIEEARKIHRFVTSAFHGPTSEGVTKMMELIEDLSKATISKEEAIKLLDSIIEDADEIDEICNDEERTYSDIGDSMMFRGAGSISSDAKKIKELLEEKKDDSSEQSS